MIANFQDELYQLESKQAKDAKPHANIGQELEDKNAPKPFSKHLKDIICKIKQYLNHIVIIINQNNLSNPKDIVKSEIDFMKNFTPRRQLTKLLLLKFLAKFLRKRKHVMNNLSFVK